MGLGVWELICAVQALALATLGARWLMGRREIRTVQPGDFVDGKPRYFIGLCTRRDPDSGQLTLADVATGRPVVFSGVRSAQVQHRYKSDGSRSDVVIVIEGLKRL